MDFHQTSAERFAENICYFIGFILFYIVSVFYRGKTEFNNLKPICSSCNKDMGIHNLEEYKSSLIHELS